MIKAILTLFEILKSELNTFDFSLALKVEEIDLVLSVLCNQYFKNSKLTTIFFVSLRLSLSLVKEIETPRWL